MPPFKILFEDETLLVIDKPTGVVVNRVDSSSDEETIQDWVEHKFSIFNYQFSNTSEQEFFVRGGIVHRLDKDTSGLLVIAKTPQAFESLKNQFKQRSIVKKYLALVHGKVVPAQSTIRVPVARSRVKSTHFTVSVEGREAETSYTVLQVYRLHSSDYSFLELSPKTGRTHQIRVHLKYIGHPIVSDPIYAGRKQYQKDLIFCPRLFLHAAHLRLVHPVTAAVLDFASSLPADLQNSLSMLSLI